MAKQYKIKRYRHYGKGNSFRAAPHPLAITFGVIAIIALVGAGYLLYQPIYNLFTGDHASRIDLPEPELDLESQAEPETEPTPEPVGTVSGLRSVYLPGEIARDGDSLTAFLNSLRGTDINAVMLDIKDASGTILFTTTNENAIGWGAVAENAVNLTALSQTLEQDGLSLIVRMSAFRDPLASGADRNLAISYQQTDWLWLDAAQENGGRPWLNPYSGEARDYLSALALEAANAGAVMVVLENVQFPNGSTTNANFGPLAETVTRDQILKEFVSDLTEQLLEQGVRTAVYFTASTITQEAENATRYGGSPLDIVGENLLLDALPSQFSSGSTLGDYILEDPVQNPANTVETVLRYVLPLVGSDVTVIPMLLGGNDPAVNGGSAITKQQVDDQIAIASTRDLGDYVLYSTNGEYVMQ